MEENQLSGGEKALSSFNQKADLNVYTGKAPAAETKWRQKETSMALCWWDRRKS